MNDYLTLGIQTGNFTHYHTCQDEGHNAEYLNHIGFSWDTAIKIAAWATMAPEGAKYEQDELSNVEIFIM